MCLTPMAYQWCSAIFEKMRECGEDEPDSDGQPRLRYINSYSHLLSLSLAVAFHHIGPNSIDSPIHLSHTHHHEQMLNYIFAMESDDSIADALYVWIVDRQTPPSGSCTHQLLKLTERDWPFSTRLRQTILHTILELWDQELEAAGLEFVCLLHNLGVGMGEVDDAEEWMCMLIGVLRSPVGQEHLSSHYWLLLRDLVPMAPPPHIHWDREAEIMKSLEEAQDWEKLEIWMLILWWAEYVYSGSDVLAPNPIQDIKQATLILFQQRWSAIPRFEDFYKKSTQLPDVDNRFSIYKDEFQQICNQVWAQQQCLGFPL